MTAVVAVSVLLAVQAASGLPDLFLPPEEGAWVVRIETSGGFTGRGAGQLTASSAGTVFCVALGQCPDRLADGTVRQLSALITAMLVDPRPASSSSSSVPLVEGTCRDCVVTTMTVRYRTREGEHVQRYTWDLSTQTRIPEDVRRLHDRVVALAER